MEEDVRAEFLDKFEDYSWTFKDGVFSSTFPDAENESSGLYFVRPITDLSFEIYGTYPEEFTFLIEKNVKGFCSTFILDGKPLQGTKQCFKKRHP